MCFFLSNSFANQVVPFTAVEKCNQNEISKDINKIDKSVQYAYKSWDWEVARELIAKSTLLIQYENSWIIYGLQNFKNNLNLSDLKNTIDYTSFCLFNDNLYPFLLIIKKDKPAKNKDIQFYNFLYRSDKNTFNEYAAIKKNLGTTLLIHLISVSDNLLEELELTITHEAMHLFGQEDIQFLEPLFTFKKINDEQLISKNLSNFSEYNHCETQQINVDKFTGREYLQYTEKCNTEFNKSVMLEICLDYNLMKFIAQTNNKKDSNSKIHVLFSLKEIILEIENRSNINGDESFALEWYWYLMEGVPQYMEQRLLLEKNQTRLLSQYESYCEQREGHQEYFYPLLTGSAIWHGLDYLFDSKDEWSHLAQQLEYNIPSNKNSKFWLNNFHTLLNNKINQLTLN